MKIDERSPDFGLEIEMPSVIEYEDNNRKEFFKQTGS